MLFPLLPVMALFRQVVAIALQVRAALQDQVFDVRQQPQVSRRIDSICALTGVLDHGIAGIVDEVRVVSKLRHTRHRRRRRHREYCCRCCR